MRKMDFCSLASVNQMLVESYKEAEDLTFKPRQATPVEAAVILHKKRRITVITGSGISNESIGLAIFANQASCMSGEETVDPS